jgi:putative transposase
MRPLVLIDLWSQANYLPREARSWPWERFVSWLELFGQVDRVEAPTEDDAFYFIECAALDRLHRLRDDVRMKQKRAYQYRFYPTPEQVTVLARTFGSARYVYNWALSRRTDASYQRQERISYADTSAALTALKREPATAWLNDVSSVPPQAVRHLDRAFPYLLRGQGEAPAFKKKRGRQAAAYSTSAFRWDAEKRSLTLAKMAEPLDIRWSRAFTGDPTTISVSRDPASRYFVSFLVEEAVTSLPPTEAVMGLDRGCLRW